MIDKTEKPSIHINANSYTNEKYKIFKLNNFLKKIVINKIRIRHC